MDRSVRDQWRINRYLWACLLFVGVMIPSAARAGWFSAPLPAVCLLFGAFVANAALRTYCGWRSGGSNAGALGWVFTGVDVALISVAVRLTRGIESEFWLAYYVLLISETLFARPRDSMILGAAMSAGYLMATWPAHVTYHYALTVSVRLFFLMLVGGFARTLSVDRERRNQELALLHEQVAASDERARIAREVHDSLGHALVACIMRLELCLRLLRKAPDEAEAILRDEVPALRAAWNEGRDLAFHLRPWEREGGELAESLRRHVSRFAERTGLAVDLQIADLGADVAPAAELAVTRILQEALTNVAKHADASRVCVRAVRSDGRLTCSVQDDGRGFTDVADGSGFGLRAMRERAEHLGGHVEVTSSPGQGTTITATLPTR